jgi:hypothetical protein
LAKKKSTSNKEKPQEIVEDAEIIDAQPPIEDVEVVEESIADETEAVDEIVEDVPEEPSAVESPVKDAPAKSNSSFVPLLLGGVMAGGVGYFVGTLQNDEVSGSVAGNSVAISDVQERLGAIPATPDLGPIEQNLAELNAQFETLQGNLDQSLADLDARLDTVERQPAADGTLQDVALEAYQQDIDALRKQIEDQQSELQSMMNATATQLQATREEAVAIEERAVQSAKNAQVRSEISKIQAALENGSSIVSALTAFESASGSSAPEALQAVADGVPTLSGLVEEYPEFARQALKVARDEGQSGESTGGFTAFLREQLSIRSTTPQEGQTADAVLSRAEAALKSGGLNEALTEISGLPEVVRFQMSDWISAAELRAQAVDAAATLFTQYNSN